VAAPTIPGTPGIGRALSAQEDAMTETLSPAAAPALKDQASALLAHAAGYASSPAWPGPAPRSTPG
jgi:hypothetical protein